MTTRYRITQENGGEMNTDDLNEILAYQLHADQLVSKTQRMIENWLKEVR